MQTQQQSNRACFESHLASHILCNPQLFPAVSKLSSIIVDLLTRPENRRLIINLQLLKDDFADQLYSDTHFGKLGNKLNYCPNQIEIMDAIIDALKHKQDNLPLIMHLHQLFMQRIYDALPDNRISHEMNTKRFSTMTFSERIAQRLQDRPQDSRSCKEAIVDRLFKNEFFSQRTRQKVNGTGQLTKKIGITDQSECRDRVETELHENVLGVFTPVDGSAWLQELNQYQLPFIAGPSGHTGSSMLLALLLGNFDEEELKQYLTATIGILTGGGYHSVHEIMSVAKKIGITYVRGEYHYFLPDSFQNSKSYADLANEYSNYLPTVEALRDSSAATRASSFSMFQSVKQHVFSAIDDLLHDLFELSPNLAEACPSYIHPHQMIWQTNSCPTLFTHKSTHLMIGNQTNQLLASSGYTYLGSK